MVDRVFPAYAGMFLGLYIPPWVDAGFPRVCGDVPDPEMQDLLRLLFSPRMRGCSYHSHGDHFDEIVFPAYAGMFLISRHPLPWGWGFPRVCGDVPIPG